MLQSDKPQDPVINKEGVICEIIASVYNYCPKLLLKLMEAMIHRTYTIHQYLTNIP